MRRRHFLRASAVAGLMPFGSGCRQEAGGAVITIGAMPPGTSWYVFAATLARLLAEALPEDTRVEVVARGGAVGNPILVDRGEETIAIAQAATAAWAHAGNPVAYDRAHASIRALAGGLNRVWMAALMSEEYIARTGNATLEEALLSADPPRIVMKPQGSVVPVVADVLFAALGTSRERLAADGGQIVQVGASQISAILRNGQADLYFETAIRAHPTLTEVTTTTPMRFLDYPPQAIAALVGPGVRRVPMPAWFQGQEGPIDAVEMGTVLIAHKDLDRDLAFLVAKTVCESSEAMARTHRAWSDFAPERAGQPENAAVPLHPGAEQYYRQRGWLPAPGTAAPP